MSNSILLQAIGGLISLALLAFCINVYARVCVRLATKGGAVRVSDFQIPEALVALVLVSYFAGILWHNAGARGGDAKVTVTIEQLIYGSMTFVIFTAGVAAFLKFGRGMSLLQVFGIRQLSAPKTVGWAAALLPCALPLIGVSAYITQKFLTKDELVQQKVVELFRAISKHGDYGAITEFAVATIVVAPVCEEFLFRGFFYGVGKRFLGPWLAGFLSALFFSASHLNLASLGPLFVLAVCLTLAYERTGSILVPMGMHALFNSLNLLFMFGQAQGWFPTQ